MVNVVNQYSNYQVREKNEPSSSKKKTLYAIGASVTGSLAATPIGLASVGGMKKISGGLTNDEVKTVNQASENIVKDITNLGKKGVNVMDYKQAPSMGTEMPKFLMEMINPFYAVAKGKNALFLPQDVSPLNLKKNTVLINKDKLSLAVFHELGHAFNFNNSSFWKLMQKFRTPGMVLATGLGIFTAMTKTDNETVTTGQKIKNTVRENSPILAFAAMLPMLTEEGMASIRGCKWAKQILNPKLANKVLKTNIVAYCSYMAVALGSALGVYAAKRVKDGV